MVPGFDRFPHDTPAAQITAGEVLINELNCIACHAPEKFSDLKKHVVSQGGKALPTPSLRNMRKRNVDITKVLQAKLNMTKEAGVSKEYKQINLNKTDLTHLKAFLDQLNDVDDKTFRELILNAKILNTLLD